MANTNEQSIPVTLTQAGDIIAKTRGRYFGVTFIKKDGTVRRMVARQGVRKGVTGKGMSFDPLTRGMRIVNETVIERGDRGRVRTVATQFRSQPFSADLKEVRANGKRYHVLPS